MANTFEVQIDRYDPVKSPASCTQTYEVAYHPSQTVLEVLAEIQGTQDDTLSFRSSCEAGKCGSCAVALNGKPVLACRTVVDGGDIHIGPLPNFPVVKDLIVDRSRYEDDFLRSLSYGDAGGRAPAATMDGSGIDYENLSCCIGCLVCNAACPVAEQMGYRYPSPAVITEVLSAGVRVGGEGDDRAPLEDNIDFCSLCLNCEAACPSGVRLSRVNAQAKDAYAREKGRSLRDWMLGRAELMGRLGSTAPVLSNRVLANAGVRRAMEAALGISRRGGMVPYDRPFRHGPKRRSPGFAPSAAKRRVAYFVGCYTQYSDTDPAKDAVAVLEDLGLHVEVPRQRCCGLPLLAGGDMDAARKLARENIALLQPWVEKGCDVVVSCTSCSLMLKHEYTGVLGLEGAAGLAASTYDLGDYLRRLAGSGELKLDLGPVPLVAAYHTPCHLRAQGVGLPFVELLQKVPELEVHVLDALCCGQSGSYGFKAEKADVSEAVGRHLSESLRALAPDIGLSECGPCQFRMHGVSGLPVAHPVSILRKALSRSGA